MRLLTLAIGAFVLFSNVAYAVELKFALIDGTAITYKTLKADCVDFPKPCPRPNLEVLQSIVPSLFPNATTHLFNVLKREGNSGAFPGADNVSQASPDVILVHWSSFQAVEQKPCYPGGEKIHIDCAKAVINFLAEIYTKKPVDIVIYSRKSGICEDSFNGGLRKIVFDLIEMGDVLAGFAADIGFLAMPENNDMRNFTTNLTQSRLVKLVKALRLDDFPDWAGTKSDGLCILSSLR